MFSLARMQKKEFCPRAFYFRYLDSREFFSEEVESLLEQARLEEIAEMQRYYLVANLAREFFYLRPESRNSLRKTILRECSKLGLSESEKEETLVSLEAFIESEFYLETNPSLVNHVEVEKHPLIHIGDREVTGSVHLSWIEPQGKFNIVKISKKNDTDLSFPVLYALKKFQVLPEKLNVAVLNPENWHCCWEPIDWHAVSILQDQALSFELEDGFNNYLPTSHESRCQLCAYSQICYEYSSELDSL